MTRIIDFGDGFTSSTEPTTAGATASFLDQFASDSAFETAYGAPPYTGKNGFYFNTTVGKPRVYDGTTWRTIERELDNATGADPTVNDDNTQGYEVLSLWLNTSSGALFRATDVTTGAAVWQEIAADAALDAHINTSAIHVDWSLASQGTIHPTNYTDNDTVYTHPNHTGEVTSAGDGATVVQPTAISNKTLKAVPAGTEEVLINDAGTLKKTTAQAIADLGGGGGGVEVAVVKYFSGGAFQTLSNTADTTLNLGTITLSSGTWASVVSNQLILDGGSDYLIVWDALLSATTSTTGATTFLYAITGSTEIGRGSNCLSSGTSNYFNVSTGSEIVTPAVNTTYELRGRKFGTSGAWRYGQALVTSPNDRTLSMVIYKLS